MVTGAALARTDTHTHHTHHTHACGCTFPATGSLQPLRQAPGRTGGVGTQLEDSTRLHQGRQHAHGAWGQHGFLQASPALLLPRDLEDGGVTTTGPATKATATPSRSQGEPTRTGGEDPSEEEGRHVGQHRAAGAQRKYLTEMGISAPFAAQKRTEVANHPVATGGCTVSSRPYGRSGT